MISPLAHVDGSVLIGQGTQVWQFASVIRKSVVGVFCSIGAGAIVDAATVGDDCLIGAGAQLHPGTKIGSSVFVGPGAVFCNDAWPSVSKDGFDSGVLLRGEFVTAAVEDHVSIGARAVILPGVRIGEYARIAAGAVVGEDVPPRHIFKRSGAICEIDGRSVNRMRAA